MNGCSDTSNETFSSDKSLKAQSHIWKHIFNFINSASLKCAVQMGIPEIIHNHGKPMTLKDLCAALPVHCNKVQHLYRLMRVLIHSGFFSMQQVFQENIEEQGYVLTPSSYYLLSDHPMSIVPFLLAAFDPSLIRPWDCMNAWFKTDEGSPFETANGRSLWEQAAIDPRLNDWFNKAMACDARLVSSVVLDKCGWVFEGLESVVDVGGGTGTMAHAIAKAFPCLSYINFDLPHVVAGLEGSGNIKHVEGDMFESIPQGHAILLKWILHDWSDEKCIKILMNCKKALVKENGEKGGKLIIIDMGVGSKEKDGDIEATETQLLFDMLVMTLV